MRTRVDRCAWCNQDMEYPYVALSRLSKQGEPPIYVCPPCGADEAFAQYDSGGIPFDWRKYANPLPCDGCVFSDEQPEDAVWITCENDCDWGNR